MTANFRDVSPNLQFEAGESFRRNLAGDAFETYTPPASAGDIEAIVADAIAALTTDDIPESPTKFYFTDERVQDALAAALVNSDTITFSYNDAAGQIQAEVAVPTYTLRLDEAAPITYIGEAIPGTSEAAAGWRIKRITETGNDIDIKWAGGAATFTQIWANRLSLTYT